MRKGKLESLLNDATLSKATTTASCHGLLGECVVDEPFLSVDCSTWGLKGTTRMSMTVVVREDLCVYEGGAWAL